MPVPLFYTFPTPGWYHWYPLLVPPLVPSVGTLCWYHMLVPSVGTPCWYPPLVPPVGTPVGAPMLLPPVVTPVGTPWLNVSILYRVSDLGFSCPCDGLYMEWGLGIRVSHHNCKLVLLFVWLFDKLQAKFGKHSFVQQ